MSIKEEEAESLSDTGIFSEISKFLSTTDMLESFRSSDPRSSFLFLISLLSVSVRILSCPGVSLAVDCAVVGCVREEEEDD